MDDETAEMEAITDEMRLIMGAWLEAPESQSLKTRYQQLQAAYQQAFLLQKKVSSAEVSQ